MAADSQLEELQAATGKVLASYAGYMNTWSIELGLRLGLFDAIRENPGISAGKLAEALNYDPLYTKVWCNATYAGGFIERSNRRLRVGTSHGHGASRPRLSYGGRRDRVHHDGPEGTHGEPS